MFLLKRSPASAGEWRADKKYRIACEAGERAAQYLLKRHCRPLPDALERWRGRRRLEFLYALAADAGVEVVIQRQYLAKKKIFGEFDPTARKILVVARDSAVADEIFAHEMGYVLLHQWKQHPDTTPWAKGLKVSQFFNGVQKGVWQQEAFCHAFSKEISFPSSTLENFLHACRYHRLPWGMRWPPPPGTCCGWPTITKCRSQCF